MTETLVSEGAGEPASPENGRRFDIDQVRGSEFLMSAQQFPGYSSIFFVVANGICQHGRVNDNHPRQSPS